MAPDLDNATPGWAQVGMYRVPFPPRSLLPNLDGLVSTKTSPPMCGGGWNARPSSCLYPCLSNDLRRQSNADCGSL